SQWQKIWNETVRQGTPQHEATFNISGFNSSYTGLPIAPEQVREWVDNAVARVRQLQPRRLLEIGCGTGLLLWRLAADCEEYVGTDFSAEALAAIQAQLDAQANQWRQVRLDHRPAHDFSELPQGHFDLVLIHSVIQYFPSIEYLLQVIEGVAGCLRQGGWLYLGDVRSLPLLEGFHAEIELERASTHLPLAQLREQIARRGAQEQELVIDPAFFPALQKRFPGLRLRHLGPKRGHHANEFTAFRYDVLLQLDAPASSAPEQVELPVEEWDAPAMSPRTVAERLERERPARLLIRRVADARNRGARELLQRLRESEAEGRDHAGQLRPAAEERGTGIDPEQWWALGTTLPYAIELRWSGPGADFVYDVLFVRRDGVAADLPGLQPFEPAPAIQKTWSSFATNPLQGLFHQKLAPELRAFVQRRLPESAVPSAFVLMAKLPLTPSGKLNRRALPAPSSIRAATSCAPSTPEEQTLAAIWSSLLGGVEVGVEDDFFSELGGHSLLATQVMSRVRDHFQVELPLRLLFENPTVAALAAAIVAARPTAGGSAPAMAPLATRARVDALSEDEVEAMLRELLASRANP
ncbi:MAG TPA: methyltransferase, partial [Chthoniobacteraceae bacterium]|nr:methyltransferase [Chthoniobacteraceae bacterium]